MNSYKPYSHVSQLKKRAEFLAVRHGQKQRGKYFILEAVNRQNLSGHHEVSKPRIGFTVTKRQGNAVKRNRIRRRLKEAVRLEIYQYMNLEYDYVLVGHKGILKANFNDLISHLKQCFKNIQNSDKTRGFRYEKSKNVASSPIRIHNGKQS